MADQVPRPEDGKVVQLRAVDAGTEVSLDEDQAAPAYVDLTSGDAQRRDIIPAHWRSRENAKRHIALMAARHGHRAAYHGVRSPAYFAKAVAFAVWGVAVTAGNLIAWWHIPGTSELEREAAANGLIHDHLRIHKQGRETRKARGTILALCLAAVTVAMVAMVAFAPWWGWALFAVAGFAALALAGRPQGKTITTKAEIPAQVQPPTQDVIIRALGSMGIAEVNKAIKTGDPISFPSPVREDGPGWRFEVDLPYGVTAAQVIDRRPQLASGLRRPLGAVWPRSSVQRARWSPARAGSAAPTSPRRSPRRGRGCEPAAATCSARSRSVPTRGSAASRGTWSSTTGLRAPCPDRARRRPCGSWSARPPWIPPWNCGSTS